MKLRSLLLSALLLAWMSASHAAPPKPFVSGSMGEIVSAHAGKPFILGLWSLSCTHCRADLEILGRLAQKYPSLPLVLVATDSVEESAAVGAVLDKYGLGGTASWVFADAFTERLYFEIDRKWRGELPRTYFYDAGHRARAVSGKLDEAETATWVKRELVP